jgi:uncharacterized membrane protein YhaH (DUF805 family)
LTYRQAITRAFLNAFNFRGRAQRSEFWRFLLFTVLGLCVFRVLDVVALGLLGTPLFSTLFALAVAIPVLAVMVRRLHDTDRSAWWLFVPFGVLAAAFFLYINTSAAPSSAFVEVATIAVIANLVLIGFFLLIVWLSVGGTNGVNRFGADPSTPKASADVFS